MIKCMEYITASCVIEKHTVYKNGELVYTSGGLGATDFLGSVYGHFDLQYPKFYKMDNLSKLGWLAAELLVQDSSGLADYPREEIAVVLSNSNSSVDTDFKYKVTTNDLPSPSLFVYTLPNIMIGEICIRHNFKGENAFFLCESFDPELIARYAGLLLDQGIARVCVAGWVELLGDEYKAALFLIGKEPAGALVFSAENMNNIFEHSILRS